MLSRKQQWRRIKIRRSSRLPGFDVVRDRDISNKGEDGRRDLCCSSSAAVKQAFESDGADSDQTTLSTWSSFGSLDEDDDAGAALPLPPPAPAVNHSVSFQDEVQVFLVMHKSEIDVSAKQALWWTGREAAINKRAWLDHIGQPGCGRQSARRPLQHCSSHFLGAGRNTAAGRGRGGGSGAGFEAEQEGRALNAAAQALLAGGVGILGCLCPACLAEGEMDERDEFEAQQREENLLLLRQQQQQQQELPPAYDCCPPPAYYSNRQLPPFYNEVYANGWASAAVASDCGRDHYFYPPRPQPPIVPLAAASAATGSGGYGGGRRTGAAARGPSKSWPSPRDWDREDDLGGKGSRSDSPDMARGRSPLSEACQAYDDDDDVFPSGSYFFD